MSKRIHIWSSSVAGPRVLLKVEKPVGLPALANAPFEAPWPADGTGAFGGRVGSKLMRPRMKARTRGFGRASR